MNNAIDVGALRGALANTQLIFADPDYRDLQRGFTHDRLVKMAQNGKETSDPLLNYVRDRMLLANSSAKERAIQKEYFLDELWPLLFKLAKPNQGTGQFLLETGVSSDFIHKFFYNIQRCLAKAVLPASGIGDSLMGVPKVIPSIDSMFPYIGDQSYKMIQYRVDTARDILIDIKGKIFCPGGGLLPEVFTGGYPLGKLDQEFIVYDTDPTLPLYLEKIIGGKLKDFGIEYRCGDCRSIRAIASEEGTYSAILANGLMSYTIKDSGSFGYDTKEFASLIELFSWLLQPGGQCFFDVQLAHLILLFCVLVLYWPKGMCTIKDFNTAKTLVTPILRNYNFTDIKFSHEPVRADIGEKEAGIYTIARKAA